MTRRKAVPGTLQVRQRILRVARSTTKASPKLLAMKATRWLSGEKSARSPKLVINSMLDGRWSSALPDWRWPSARPAQSRLREIAVEPDILHFLLKVEPEAGTDAGLQVANHFHEFARSATAGIVY